MDNRFRIIVLLTLISPVLYSQALENKFTVYVSVSTNSMRGSELQISEDFIMPSLYSNFSRGSSSSFGGNFKVLRNMEVGLEFDFGRFTEWEMPDETAFSGSEIRNFTISPGVKYSRPVSRRNLLNHLYFYVHAGPAFCITKITTVSIIDIENNNVFSSEGERVYNYINPGAFARIGVEYRIANFTGIFADLGNTIFQSNSSLTMETYYSYSSFRIGMIIPLLKERHYYY